MGLFSPSKAVGYAASDYNEKVSAIYDPADPDLNAANQLENPPYRSCMEALLTSLIPQL